MPCKELCDYVKDPPVTLLPAQRDEGGGVFSRHSPVSSVDGHSQGALMLCHRESKACDIVKEPNINVGSSQVEGAACVKSTGRNSLGLSTEKGPDGGVVSVVWWALPERL